MTKSLTIIFSDNKSQSLFKLMYDIHILIKMIGNFIFKAPVAQLDRALDYGSGG